MGKTNALLIICQSAILLSAVRFKVAHCDDDDIYGGADFLSQLFDEEELFDFEGVEEPEVPAKTCLSGQVCVEEGECGSDGSLIIKEEFSTIVRNLAVKCNKEGHVCCYEEEPPMIQTCVSGQVCVEEGECGSDGSLIIKQEFSTIVRNLVVKCDKEDHVCCYEESAPEVPEDIYGGEDFLSQLFDNGVATSNRKFAINRLSEKNRGLYIRLSERGLVAEYFGRGRTGSGRKKIDRVSSIIADNPAVSDSEGFYYYEVKVLSTGSQGGVIAIGFATENADADRDQSIGWPRAMPSFGYHLDNGKLYSGSGKGQPWGPDEPIADGDVIGCGLRIRKTAPQFIKPRKGTIPRQNGGDDAEVGEIFFTKNGEILGTAFRNVSLSADLFPTLSLHDPGARLSVNFGAEPRLFDLYDIDSANPACTITVDGPRVGRPCVLPYRLGNEITYYDCTWKFYKKTNGQPWCSTKVDDTGKHVPGHWANCNPICSFFDKT